jgi:hypothetical protein
VGEGKEEGLSRDVSFPFIQLPWPSIAMRFNLGTM